MRTDMNTVVHDTYRHGRSLVLKPGRAARNAEALPTREGMRRRYQVAWGRSMKESCESFVALRRYLEKQVGRPWDDVYSEIRQSFDARSWPNQRVLQKVRWWVSTTGLFIEQGTVLQACEYMPPKPPTGLYVHPVSGVLLSANSSHRKPDYHAYS